MRVRVRTDEKRRQIVEVAAELFQEQGYDRTSMSQISERLGGSKATLYGYFKSKEELLLAVLDIDVNEQADQLMATFIASPTLRDAFVFLGVAYMERRLSPRPIALCRIVASQPEDSGIGHEFYENVLSIAWQRLCNRIRIMMDEGLLIKANPWIAAMHWKGMVDGDQFERRMLGAAAAADPKEIRIMAEAAADGFIKLYGVAGEKTGREKLRGPAGLVPLTERFTVHGSKPLKLSKPSKVKAKGGARSGVRTPPKGS